MALSLNSLEILLDLIEIKVCSLEIQDHEDMRELNRLKRCRQELKIEFNIASLNKPTPLASQHSVFAAHKASS